MSPLDYEATLDEALWKADAARYGWQLPPKAHWLLRLPVIRHIRAAVLDYRVSRAG